MSILIELKKEVPHKDRDFINSRDYGKCWNDFRTFLEAIELPSVYEIAHIFSGTDGIGAYTPEQLKKAEAIHALYEKRLKGEGE